MSDLKQMTYAHKCCCGWYTSTAWMPDPDRAAREAEEALTVGRQLQTKYGADRYGTAYREFDDGECHEEWRESLNDEPEESPQARVQLFQLILDQGSDWEVAIGWLRDGRYLLAIWDYRGREGRRPITEEIEFSQFGDLLLRAEERVEEFVNGG
jgi:hypothetical protein